MSEPEWTRTHATERHSHWWWRPGWGVGKRLYTWHLLFDGHPELRRLVRGYQASLRVEPGYDLIPARWLHLTMQSVGFSHAVEPADLATVVEATRSRLADLDAPEVTFHRCVIRPESVALPPQPVAAIDGIRDAVRAGIADAWGVEAVPEEAADFQPHVSVAYSSRAGTTSHLVDVLDRPDMQPVTVTISHASLIELHRDNRMYEWTVLDSAPLGLTYTRSGDFQRRE